MSIARLLYAVFTVSLFASTGDASEALLIEAKAADKKWNERQDQLDMLLPGWHACDSTLPEQIKGTWAAHDEVIAAWNRYYDALQREYRQWSSLNAAERQRAEQEMARIEGLARIERAAVARANHRALADPNPSLKEIVQIRNRSLVSLERTLFLLKAIQVTSHSEEQRSDRLVQSVVEMRTALRIQDVDWDSFYRGQLLGLRGDARVKCPAAYEKYYQTIEPPAPQ